MKLTKTAFKPCKLKFKPLLNLFLVISLIGCAEKGFLYPKNVKVAVGQGLNADNKQAIVLIHGLASPHDLRPMREKLAIDFPNVTVVELNRTDSEASPISQQAKDAFEELERMQMLNKEVILIGDSQGGVLVLKLYEDYKQRLNVVGIIVNHAPLEGTRAANISYEGINKLDSAFQTISPLIAKCLHKNDKIKNLSLKKSIPEYMYGPGLKDLKTNSPFIQSVKQTLENIQIPVLAIGGTVEPIAGLIEWVKFFSGTSMSLKFVQTFIQQHSNNKFMHVTIKELEKAFSVFVGDTENDCLVPLHSQLGKNISTGANFEAFSVTGYPHFCSMTDRAEVYKKILEFINKNFRVK
jgi:esterase/lipase